MRAWLFLLIFVVLGAGFVQAAIVSPDVSKLIELEVKEHAGVLRIDWPVEGQIPLPRGQISDITKLRILTYNGSTYNTIPSQFQTGSLHGDGSLNLVRYYFRTNNLSANASSFYYLYVGSNVLTPEPVPFPLTSTDLGNEIRLDTSNSQGHAIEIILDELRFSLAKSVRVNGNYIWPTNTTTRGFFMEDSSGVVYSSLNAPTMLSWAWDGSYTKVLKVEGSLKSVSNQSSLTYTAYVQFHAGTSRVDVKGITFMNRGLRTMATNGNHWRFKEIKFQSDIGITGTKTLQTDFYSESNYSTESVQVVQDATSGKIDQQIIPSVGGADDLTPGNAFDNIYHRVRKDGVQVSNAGGISTSNPSTNAPLQPIPNTQGNGLLHLSAAGQQFTAAYYHFWQTMPKSIRVSNSIFSYDLWPKQNVQNDFTHAQGLTHGVTNASNPTTYYDNSSTLTCTNPGNSACNLFFIPDSQSYVLEAGKGVVTRFGFLFDGASGMSAVDFSKAYQVTLIALPPEWYWGSASPSGQLTSDFLPWYVETRNWGSQSGFSQSLKDAATYSDKWGRSMWDSSQVCANASLSMGECYTLLERLARGGNGRGHTGRFPFLWTLYGEQQWGSDQPDADAYGLSEGAVVSALRSRDARGVTVFPLDQWIINNTWFWQNPSTDINGGGYRYQNGDYTLGTDSGAYGGSSRRHNIFAGKLLHAAITGDWSEKDALLIATRRITGNYSGWVQVGSMAAGGENAHRAKDIMGLVYLYYFTGDASYLNTAKQVVLASKTFMDTCYAKFGTHWTTDVSYLGDIDCRLPNGDTYGGEQSFMMGYWMRALAEFNRAWKHHYQQNDPVIYPWSLITMQEYANIVILPHISSSTLFSMPKEILIYRSASPPSTATATSACIARVQGFTTLGAITALSGGTQQAYLVECFAGSELFNGAYWIVGIAFLFEETGNANYQLALSDLISDVILNSGSTPSNPGIKIPTWRHGDLGSADIKIAAPFTHEIHQGLSVLASPPSATPSLSLIAPSSISLNAAASITLTGANIPNSPQVQIGSGLTITPTSSSSTSVAFSLTAVQVNALGVGTHQVSVISGSTQTNSVSLSVIPASSIPSIQNLSPPIGTSFVQGNAVPLSASIINALSTELLSVTVEVQAPNQSSLSTVYSTQLTANSSGVLLVHNYVLPPSALTGTYNWRITVMNAAGTTISNIFSFSVSPASSSNVLLSGVAPSLVNPSLVIPGSPITITLSGSGFVSGTTVSVGSLTIPSVSTTIVSPVQLTFLLYANDLANLGNGDHLVRAQNANGTSNALSLSVNPAVSSPPTITVAGPVSNVVVNPGSTLIFSATIVDSSASPMVDVSLLIQGPGQTTPIVVVTEPFMTSQAGSNYTYALFVPPAAVLGDYFWSFGVNNPSNGLSAFTSPQLITLQSASTPSVCGDNVCSATETCLSCSNDCACVTPSPIPSPSPPGGGNDGGNGGNTGSSRPRNPFVPVDNSIGNGTGSPAGNSSETPLVENGNPATDFLAGIGSAVVGAVTNDSATDFTLSLLVGLALLLVVIGAAAYFLGLI